MVEGGGGGGPVFPVMFFDGEREMNIGDVKINPTLEYKPFQLMLSQKIGISPNQISIYLVDRRKHPKLPFSEDRRRIPITGKVNFSLICRQKDCYFLVVLKRSRKARNRRDRATSGLNFGDLLSESEFHPPAMHSVPDNLILLRRNQLVPFHDQNMQSELVGSNDRLQSLEQSYQMTMGRAVDLCPNIDDWYYFPLMVANDESSEAYCEECVNAAENEISPSFHHCVNDAVVTRFNPWLGPIGRPYKPEGF